MKGACDYLSWSSASAYRQALPGAELVYLHRAGHSAYQDQPGAFLATVRAFLTGQPCRSSRGPSPRPQKTTKDPDRNPERSENGMGGALGGLCGLIYAAAGQTRIKVWAAMVAAVLVSSPQKV